ncbi:ribonuclease III [candidate division KSB1 bacterium]
MSFISFFRKIKKILGGSREVSSPLIEIPVGEIEKTLGYKIRDFDNFKKAFIHKSFSSQNNNLKCNERLEFLGDAVLNFVVTDYLFNHYKSEWEGELTKKRALLVNKKILAEISENFELGKYLIMSSAEEKDGGRTKQSIMANAIEAIIGAIYIDSGFDSAKDFIIKRMYPDLVDIFNSDTGKNYKGELIEYCQKKHKETPDFKLIEEMGPDHDKTYIVEVFFNGHTLGTGKGKTKKDAEQKAACVALTNFNYF